MRTLPILIALVASLAGGRGGSAPVILDHSYQGRDPDRAWRQAATERIEQHRKGMWGFWQGQYWAHNAPLLREDWSLKPAGWAWRDLLFKQWWTQTRARTDDGGIARIRGFLGDYEIAATNGERNETVAATLPRKEGNSGSS